MTRLPAVALTPADVALLPRLPSVALLAEADAFAEARIDAGLLLAKLEALNFNGKLVATKALTALVTDLLLVESDIMQELNQQGAEEDEPHDGYEDGYDRDEREYEPRDDS